MIEYVVIALSKIKIKHTIKDHVIKQLIKLNTSVSIASSQLLNNGGLGK